MQNAVSSPRPERIAKSIANIKLLGHIPQRTDTRSGPAQEATHLQRSPVTSTPPTDALVPVNLPKATSMAGVSTQTDPITQQVPDDPAVNPQGTAQPPRDPGQQVTPATEPHATPAQSAHEMADLRNMIKELKDQVDRNQRQRSRTPPDTQRRRRSSSRDRRYSPASQRGSARARRTSTGRRRSSSRRSSRRRSHSPRRRSRTRSHSRRRRRHSSSPSPRRSSDRSTAAAPQGEITAAIAAQYPTMGTHAGKRLPITGLTLEPYRSLPPDLRKKARERRSRRDLTFPEHMCGFLRMISSSLDPASEAHAALNHAASVAQDAATLPWQAVREWTQACMATIEDRDATWHDVGLFTNERTRLSWIRGRQLEVDQHYPCPSYNKGKCDHKSTHAAEGNTWKHICAICLHATGQEKTTHGASTCRQRNQSRQNDDYRPDYRHKGPQNRQRKDKQDNAPKN